MDTGQEGTATLSASELSRLVEISTKLATLNETLRNELEGSKRNSGELRRMLETSKGELEALRSELESLRTTSTALVLSAESSETESAGLKTALSKAETSLKNLEASFESYRSAAEATVARLERDVRRMKVALFVAGVLAVSGWSAFAAQAAF